MKRRDAVQRCRMRLQGEGDPLCFLDVWLPRNGTRRTSIFAAHGKSCRGGYISRNSASERALSQIAQAGAASSSSSFGDAAQKWSVNGFESAEEPRVHFQEKIPYSFPAWKFGLTSWISFGDSQFQKAFDEVEKLKVNEDTQAIQP